MTGGTKVRAALYGRVSTQEQAEKGYSIDGQVQELRSAIEGMGREIIAIVRDPGFSRDNIDRPGIDAIMDLAAAGAVDEIWAWQWDRYGEFPVPETLADQLAKDGVALRSLDDSGVGEDAEMFNSMKSIMSRRERRNTARRSRNGRLEKAGQGKLIGNHKPHYGYRYNDARDGYVVDTETIPTVRRIFREVAEGHSLSSVVMALNNEGTAAPGGASGKWGVTFVTGALQDDVYKPHSYQEIAALVRPDVAARLDPEGTYGIYWYNRQRVKTVKTTVPDGNGGKRQKRRNIKTDLPRDQWIAVPVPDAGIPLEVVEAARAGIRDNKRLPKVGDRFWELSGGILRCGSCGRAMRTHAIRKNIGPTYYYYGCPWHSNNQTCTNRKVVNAAKLESRVADFVADLLSDEGRLIEEIDALIEQERATLRDPEPEARALAEKIAGIDQKIEGYWDLAASGDIPKDRMRAKVAELEDLKAEAERGLRSTDERRERIAELERDKAALQEDYRRRAESGGLSGFTPEQRHDLYRRLRLTVRVFPGDGLDVGGEVPLAYGRLDHPYMIVTEEWGIAEDLNGETCCEGLFTIREGVYAAKGTRSSTG